MLALLGRQLTHEEIGRRLFISVRTVESHVASLRRKLALPDHRALVRYATVHADDAGSGLLGTRPSAPLTSFVGRGGELAALQAAVRDARVVTAVGPGGVGKTRLAWAAVSALAPEFDGVRWVDLAPLTEAVRVDDAVARACDAPTSSRLGPVEALVSAFGARAVLLALDNAEHVVDAVAVLVERLALACPQLHLLLTSRARLALPFERVVRIEGLSPGVGGRRRRPLHGAGDGRRQPAAGRRLRCRGSPPCARRWATCRWPWSSPPSGCRPWDWTAWSAAWSISRDC